MLSCSCNTGDDYEQWYLRPHDFEKFDKNRRKRCCSCKKLISQGAVCLRFERARTTNTDIEERIYGDEVPLADKFMCEWCGEMYFNLTEAGYCYSLCDSIPEMMKEYWELTGFSSNKIEQVPA